MIRVAIIADTDSRAVAVAALLADEERLEVVEARAVTAVSSRERRVDVIVVAGLTRAQIPRLSGLPLVVLSDAPGERSFLRRQVRAWLPANASPEELTAAIVAAVQRLVTLTEEQTRRWLHVESEDDEGVPEALTARELEVLRMLADGLGNKEVAERLGISGNTVKFHVAQILAKLGVGSRAEAVATGMRRGLVPI